MPDITSAITLSMIEQIRMKQCATAQSINAKQHEVVKIFESQQDMSGEAITKEIMGFVTDEYSNYAAKGNILMALGAATIGYPVAYNKTTLQIGYALEYMQSKGDDLLEGIVHGRLHNGLQCKVDKELPSIGSDSKTSFWGNENSSVSNVMLSLILAKYGKFTYPEISDGGATFFPYLGGPIHNVDTDLVFANNKGMVLFGDYQFGGHRYWETQHPLSPEDCSSAIAKAIGASDEQLKQFTTKYIREEKCSKFQPKGLQDLSQGDLCLKGGHVMVVWSNADTSGAVKSLEFTRSIEKQDSPKMLGGGSRDVGITDGWTAFGPNFDHQLHETSTLGAVLHGIDYGFESSSD